jgi:hypothetical protein
VLVDPSWCKLLHIDGSFLKTFFSVALIVRQPSLQVHIHRVIEGKGVDMKRMLLNALIAAAVIAVAPTAIQSAESGTRLSYGPFSIVWPAAPRLAYQAPGQGGARFSTYAVTVSSLTFTLSYVQFPSPQMRVGAADFVRNMTTGHTNALVLATSSGKVRGSAAVSAIYRIGDTTTVAYSLQPTPFLNYVFTVAGPDNPELRARAQEFSESFRKD